MEKKINEEELFIPKTKHKALKIILAIILIGALIAGGYLIYKEKFCNPNRTVNNLIVDAENDLKNFFNNVVNDHNKYKINGLVKIDANLSDELKDIANLIKNVDLQFNGECDTDNKLANLTVNTKYKNEKLIDMKIYQDGDNLYLLLDELYDKYLKTSLKDIQASNKTTSSIDINENDIKSLANSMVKALKDALYKLEFKRESTTIKIDDKNIDVYNNYVELNEKDIKNLIKDIVNILQNDDSFNSIFKKLTHEDAKEGMSALIKELDNQKFPGTYRLNFYTNKNLLNQKLVSIRLENTNDNITSNVNYDKINDDEALILINTNGVIISSRVKKTNSIFNISLNASALGMSAKLEINTNFEKIKEVTKLDVSNSQDIEKLSQEEIKTIEEKMQNNKGLLSFVEDISKVSSIKK